jgi:hypothetical protein
MLGHAHVGHMHRPKYYEDSYSSGSDGLGRDRERMLAELLRQRQGGMFGGHHQGLGGMGSPHPFMRGHGTHPMMGGIPRPGFPPPVGMMPGMGLGIPPGMGMDMGLGMRPGMGMGPNMGMNKGSGRLPFNHSPFRDQRPSPFGYSGPGPPRAHPFFLQNHYDPSPHARPRHHLFSTPRRMFDNDDDDDDYEHEYPIPARHRHARQMRRGFRFVPRHLVRRRAYRPGMFEETDDEFDEYDDYDDGFEHGDDFEGYMSRRSAQRRWLGGY